MRTSTNVRSAPHHGIASARADQQRGQETAYPERSHRAEDQPAKHRRDRITRDQVGHVLVARPERHTDPDLPRPLRDNEADDAVKTGRRDQQGQCAKDGHHQHAEPVVGQRAAEDAVQGLNRRDAERGIEFPQREAQALRRVGAVVSAPRDPLVGTD
jgi:hypothetical protein